MDRDLVGKGTVLIWAHVFVNMLLVTNNNQAGFAAWKYIGIVGTLNETCKEYKHRNLTSFDEIVSECKIVFIFNLNGPCAHIPIVACFAIIS